MGKKGKGDGAWCQVSGLLESADPRWGWRPVPSKNAGQVVKAFCADNGIDVNGLGSSTPNKRTRVKKRRLQGGEISSPSLLPPSTITTEILQLMEGRRFLLGEACVPYWYEVQVQGRKLPLPVSVRSYFRGMGST